MGEIADMMIEGILDSETGEFIDDELSAQGGPGFPRSMNSRNNTVYKYSSKVNGVIKYLKMKLNLKAEERYDYCVNYIIKEVDSSFDPDSGWEVVADVIQENFGKFAKYVTD